MSKVQSASPPWLVDAWRARLYRFARPWLGSLYADRTRRVTVIAVVSIISSFAVTLIAPLWSLALGPVILGVPHLIADARYLVVQPQLHERKWLWLAAIPLVATCLGAPPFVGLLALLPVLALAKGTVARRAVVILVTLALLTCALLANTTFTFAFLHLHNLVAVAWWWWFRPRTKASLGALVLLILATSFLFTPAALDLVTFFNAWNAPSSATSFTEFTQSHAFLMPLSLAPSLVLSFCFLQSLHYAAWLRLVPEDARARPAPRNFKASWTALQADFGAPLLWAFLLLAIGISLWGAFDLFAARQGYLRLAAFHGYLELAAAAFFFIERRSPIP